MCVWLIVLVAVVVAVVALTVYDRTTPPLERDGHQSACHRVPTDRRDAVTALMADPAAGTVV